MTQHPHIALAHRIADMQRAAHVGRVVDCPQHHSTTTKQTPGRRLASIGMRASACVIAICAALLLASASASADLPGPVVVPPPPTDIAPPATARFLWPAYKYPNIADPANAWSRAIATGAGQTFIVNPNNGPGTAVNPAYQAAINAARTARIGLLGYVWTDYGKRSLAAVKADINRWRTLYGVRSIFLDEVASQLGSAPGSTNLIDYYRQLHTYIHAAGGTVMLNPGAVPNQQYLTAAETIVVFEGSAAAYSSAQFPQWVLVAPNSKIAYIVYGATAAQEGAIVQRAHTLGAGYIFVTDDTLPNPYDSLPSYYLTERAQISALT